MRKTRSEASWNKLSAEQLNTLDKWLFEEKRGYAAILPQAQSELGFPGQMTSLKRYYTRRKQERIIENLAELRKHAGEICKERTDPSEVRAASMKLLDGYLFQAVQEAPEEVKTWAPVAKVILQHDHNQLLRELKGEENQLRREAMAFAKEKFEFDIVEKAVTALPQLKELAEARKDPETRRYEENIRRNKLRRMMFGPGHEVEPESQQEEAEMLAAKAEREARRQKKLQYQSGQTAGAGPPGPSSKYYQEYMEEQKREEDGKAGEGSVTE